MKLRAEWHPKRILLGVIVSENRVDIGLGIFTIHITFYKHDDPNETQRRIKK